MTIDEIFSILNEHMIEGLMTHSQLSDYFGFLGLDGYQMCHKYHYFEENCNYKKLGDYYLHHYNKIIIEKPFKNPSVIPENWYQYSRQDVNPNTRKNAIQVGMDKWVKWEQDTKKLYEALYQEAMKINEVSAAQEIKKYVIDVDEELAYACQRNLELNAMEYSVVDIILQQEDIKQKYQEKLEDLELC